MWPLGASPPSQQPVITAITATLPGVRQSPTILLITSLHEDPWESDKAQEAQTRHLSSPTYQPWEHGSPEALCRLPASPLSPCPK